MRVQKIRAYSFPTAMPYIALSCALLLFCLAWNRVVHHDGTGFWDARVYPKAVHAWMTGVNPYAHGKKEAPFLYPPIFLWAVKLTSSYLPPGGGWPIYLTAHFLAALTIPYLLARYYCRKAWMTPFVALALIAFQPDIYSLIAMLGGNIATLLSLLLLAAGVPGIRSDRWGWFYPAVVLASSIKPTYLAWLLLPLFSGNSEYWGSLLAVGTTGAVYWLQAIFSPALYAQFRSAVMTSSYVREAGVGIYAYALRIVQKLPGTSSSWSTNCALLIHGLVMVPVLIAIFLLRRYRKQPEAVLLWLPLLVVAATLVNPRMMEYDADVAIVPAVYIWVECMGYALARHIAGGVFAVTLAILSAMLSKDPHAAVVLFLLASLVLALARIAVERSAKPVEAASTHA